MILSFIPMAYIFFHAQVVYNILITIKRRKDGDNPAAMVLESYYQMSESEIA